MLNLFLKRQRGVITVMLSIVLIAALSINATFMETARYRSLTMLYKEMVDSASFSVLSQYDRELFKNYGLLGIPADTGKDELLRYLNANLNQDVDRTGIENMLSLSPDSVEFDKLYTLAQSEVFKEQINEFCAFRAPVTMLNNTLDIEETMEALVEELTKALPMLEVFAGITDVLNNLLDAIGKLGECGQSMFDLDAVNNEYGNAVDAYNDAVEAYDAAVEELENFQDADTEDEDGSTSQSDGVTEESLKEQVEQAYDAVVDRAEALRSTITNLTGAIENYWEAKEAFIESYGNLLGAGIDTVLEEGKAEVSGIEDEKQREQAKDLLEYMKGSYEESTGLLEDFNQYVEKTTEDLKESAIESLEEQHEALAAIGESPEEIEPVRLNLGFALSIVVEFSMTTIQAFVEALEELGEMLKTFGVVFDLVSLMTTGGKADVRFNNMLDEGYYNALSGMQRPGGGMETIQTYYDNHDPNTMLTISNDQALKVEQLNDARGITQTGDELIDYMSGSPQDWEENNVFQQAMENMSYSSEQLKADLRSLNGSWTTALESLLLPGLYLAQQMRNIINVLVSLHDFFVRAIELVKAFINLGGPSKAETFQQIVFQRFYVSMYASEMFSNRTTGSGSKRMNGSSLPTANSVTTLIPEGQCFDQADLEYIYAGGTNEIKNQEVVFNAMFALRVLCNIPAILSDQTLMEVVSGLSATIIGIIFAVILVVAILMVEAYTDMLFLVFEDGGKVDIIKFTGYYNLEGEGIDDAMDHLENMAKDKFGPYQEAMQSGKSSETQQGTEKIEKKEEKSFDQKYAEGLLKWSYKDHMFFMLELFKGSDVMYGRIANLTEMRMRQDGNSSFSLGETATYIRVESEPTYTPLLPIPSYPGLNSSKIKISNLHYCGY